MKNQIRLFMAVCLLVSTMPTKAQDANFYDIMHDLTAVQSNFLTKENGYMSCKVRFIYSMISAPQKFLDTLSGIYKVAGTKKYTNIGNIEVLQNDTQLLAVYHPQKMMVVSPSQTKQNRVESIFITTLDSTFILENVKAATIVNKGGTKTMTFSFAENSLYDSLVMVYDATSYVPTKIAYVLRPSRRLLDDGTWDAEMITVAFSGYNNLVFDALITNVSKFVSALPGRRHKAALGYTDYLVYDNGN